jgi:hypothetical protein
VSHAGNLHELLPTLEFHLLGSRKVKCMPILGNQKARIGPILDLGVSALEIAQVNDGLLR